MFTPKVSIPPSPSATRSLFPTFAVQERFIFFSIQPCSTYDVIANRPFKDKVRRVFVEHLHKSLEVYLVKFQPAQQFWRADGLVHHGQKLVKWKNLLLQVSKKCGLPVSLDGSKDHEKNSEGIQNYGMSKPFGEENLRLIEDDSNKSDGEENNI